MTPQRRWRGQTEPVRYCSTACRRRGVTAVDRSLEAAIIALLETRSQGSTICPSEAVRALDPRVTREALRAQMERARRAARRLVNAGRLEIVQRGRVVDPSTARGPVRLRRRRPD